MAKYLETHVHPGSATPSKPTSKNSGSVAGGNHPGHYNPAAAAKHLAGQDNCIPNNDGPMKMKGGGKASPDYE